MAKQESGSLSPSEWKIMKIVWELKSCAARDVYQVTQEQFGWTPGTTKTYLRRLVEKGHLKTRQIGNSYLYQPVSSAQNMLHKAADTLVNNALDGMVAPMLFRMVKHGKLSQQDIQEMRVLLDAHTEEPDVEE